jgi:hypothetical protein
MFIDESFSVCNERIGLVSDKGAYFFSEMESFGALMIEFV